VHFIALPQKSTKESSRESLTHLTTSPFALPFVMVGRHRKRKKERKQTWATILVFSVTEFFRKTYR
jgi:hypothetical protein